jgi:hypothetical protein
MTKGLSAIDIKDNKTIMKCKNVKRIVVERLQESSAQ